MKTLIIILSLITFSVSSETRLVIPLATTHIGSGEFNNQNYGLGIEYKGDYLYSATYLRKNSYSNPSIFLAASKEFEIFKNITKKQAFFSAGAAVASGYDEIHDSGYIATTLFAVTYKNIRIVTSYPFSELFCVEENNMQKMGKEKTVISECADFVNVQYIHKF